MCTMVSSPDSRADGTGLVLTSPLLSCNLGVIPVPALYLSLPICKLRTVSEVIYPEAGNAVPTVATTAAPSVRSAGESLWQRRFRCSSVIYVVRSRDSAGNVAPENVKWRLKITLLFSQTFFTTLPQLHLLSSSKEPSDVEIGFLSPVCLYPIPALPLASCVNYWGCWVSLPLLSFLSPKQRP